MHDVWRQVVWRDFKLKSTLIALALCAASFAAQAQPGPPGPSGFKRLFSVFPTSSNGNGADLTEDVIAPCAYTIPAGQLANIGDTLHIRVGGNMGATTDVKTARVKLNNLGVGATVIASTAPGTSWREDGYLAKTGSNTQTISWYSFAGNSTTAAFATVTALAITDAAPIALSVTGQNATNSVAGSITCTWLTVDFEH